jgi:Fe-S oxidoreductase
MWQVYLPLARLILRVKNFHPENHDGHPRQDRNVGKNINKNGKFEDDGKSLLHDYISVEELRACTTCNACVEECPVSINPLEIIVELRRSLVMEESNAPQEWNTMFSNVENNFAPWKFSPDDRDKWAEEMK